MKTHNEELEIVEEFYQHMLKSTPVLDTFERASLKLKFKELSERYTNSRIQEFVMEVEGMKRYGGDPEITGDDGNAEDFGYNQAINDILALSQKYISKEGDN